MRCPWRCTDFTCKAHALNIIRKTFEAIGLRRRRQNRAQRVLVRAIGQNLVGLLAMLATQGRRGPNELEAGRAVRHFSGYCAQCVTAVVAQVVVMCDN